MSLKEKISEKGLAVLVLLLILIIVAMGGFFYWRAYVYLDPASSQTYYKIFNKEEILDGSETTAAEVDQKLDKRLKKYHKTFEEIAGTSDEKKLRALFYMNFVHMFGEYGQRTLSDKTFKELLWDNSENGQCLTNTIFLEMLLDRAGYEFRTVGIRGKGDHGYAEVKFDDGWQILDPTVNLWINKDTEELLTGAQRENKRFFLKATDQPDNHDYRSSVINLLDRMLIIGRGYQPTMSEYNCCFNLSEYQY